MKTYPISLLTLCIYSWAANNDLNENTIELFFMQESSNLNSFMNGNKVYEDFYSEPTNTYNRTDNKNIKKCNEYTSCHECSINNECFWEINTCTKASSNRSKIAWWKNAATCSNLQALPECPRHLLFSIGSDSPVKLTTPNTHNESSSIIPPNTFCYWKSIIQNYF